MHPKPRCGNWRAENRHDYDRQLTAEDENCHFSSSPVAKDITHKSDANHRTALA